MQKRKKNYKCQTKDTSYWLQLKGGQINNYFSFKKHYGDTWMENPDLEFYFKNLISNKNQDTSNDENEVEIGCMASRPIEIDLPI